MHQTTNKFESLLNQQFINEQYVHSPYVPWRPEAVRTVLEVNIFIKQEEHRVKLHNVSLHWKTFKQPWHCKSARQHTGTQCRMKTVS